MPNWLISLILLPLLGVAGPLAAAGGADAGALRLSRASVPATLPMHQGYYRGEPVHFIITDSSDRDHADLISRSQRWRVELAPLLAHTPDAALDDVYLFTNGLRGEGIHGFQREVLASTPGQPDDYAAVRRVVHVRWRREGAARELTSVEEVRAAERRGQVTLERTAVVLNVPQIVWPGGRMALREDNTLSDDSPYGKAQVLDIDVSGGTVTFVAHRGWGPDGRTIYYIVTDASPAGPANMMGVIDAPTVAKSINSPAAVDLFQFRNGIRGSGPKGFQAGIASAAPGDANYSPLWRVWMIGWKDPANAAVLETMSDVLALQAAGLIEADIARPMNRDHVVNCPFIDPFQNISL